MGIIALYDTMSIQTFIYNSNKLRDNKGASLLVEDCFQKYLLKAIDHVIEEKNTIRLQWKEQLKPADFTSDSSVACEVIYIGGGNALLYFKDVELYKAINTEFSRLLLAHIPGITVISAYEAIDETTDFGKLMDTLFKKLQFKKQETRGMMTAPAMSITRTCSYTHKPATSLDNDDRWISEELEQKRKRVQESKTVLTAIGEKAKYQIQKELYAEVEDMAGEKGEQWIATVHIDGNSMGNHVNAVLKNKNLIVGTETIRKFSFGIQNVYEKAYENMLESCKKLMKDSKDFRLSKKYKEAVPFRKIYSAGDDVTFVCYGPLAIKAAELYLNEIQKCEIEGRKLSACAGIAYAKPGYPFSKAYAIAEQCCKNAKYKARDKKNTDGCYIDFQIIRGGLDDLNALRSNDYYMPSEDGRQYNLLLRPYLVLKDGEDYLPSVKKDALSYFYDFSEFIYKSNSQEKHQQNNYSIARSKFKDLRNAYCNSKEAASVLIGLMKRRYRDEVETLGQLVCQRESGVETPYIDSNGNVVLWDALEMMDLYISLEREG